MKRFSAPLCALLAALALAGCATAPRSAGRREPIFYPLPPDEPRVQFLTSLSDSRDVEKKRGGLQAFLVGAEETRPIVKPYGLDVWNGRIYVCDTMLAALVVLDLADRRFRYVQPAGAGRLSKPINIAIDRDGTKYVADADRSAVVILDAEDRYVGLLGGAGEMKPTDVAVGADRLYVTDLQNHRVGVWDKAARRMLFTIPRPEDGREEARLFSPVNLALSADGRLFVSDLGAARVQEYDRDGRYLRSFGAPGSAPGQMIRPKGVDLDGEGRLYVVDAAAELLQVFDSSGDLLLFFGEPYGEEVLLGLPASVRVDETLVPHFRHLADPSFDLERLILVSSQYGQRKISVFGLGRRKG